MRLPPGAVFASGLPAAHNAFVYAYEGELRVGAEQRRLPTHAAGVLGAGERVEVSTSEAGQGAAFILLAARPLGEPVVQYGPFVMNTRDEIEQAIADYQNGQLV